MSTQMIVPYDLDKKLSVSSLTLKQFYNLLDMAEQVSRSTPLQKKISLFRALSSWCTGYGNLVNLDLTNKDDLEKAKKSRAKAGEIFKKLGGVEYFTLLLEKSKDYHLVDTLRRVCDPESCSKKTVASLTKIVFNEDLDHFFRTSAIEALVKIRGKKAETMLIKALECDDRSVAFSAIVALGEYGTLASFKHLKSLLEKYPDWSHQILMSMGKIGGEEIERFLIDMLTREYPIAKNHSPGNDLIHCNLARSAAEALTLCGGLSSIEKLNELLETPPYVYDSTRWALFTALTTIKHNVIRGNVIIKKLER